MLTFTPRCASLLHSTALYQLLFYSVLYCTALYCTLLHCTALYYCVLHRTVLCAVRCQLHDANFAIALVHSAVHTSCLYWGVFCVPQYLLDPGKSLTGAEVNQLHIHGGSALMEVRVVVLPTVLLFTVVYRAVLQCTPV